MAKTFLQKINIIGILENKEEVIIALQKFGLVHITQINDIESSPVKIGSTQVETEIQYLSRLIDGLSQHEEKGGLLKGMLPIKYIINENKFNEVAKIFDYKPILEKYQVLERELNTINDKEHHIRIELSHLVNWQALDIKLKQLGPTMKTISILGTIPFTSYNKLLEKCDKLKQVLIETISSSKFEKRILICYHREVENEVTECLKEFNFTQYKEYTAGEMPSNIIVNYKAALLKINEERKSILKRLKGLTEYIPKLSILFDYYTNLSSQTDIQKNFIQTKNVFIIEGWIKKHDLSYLKKQFNKDGITIELAKPLRDEEVPVAIENKRLIKPFEIITNLYGLPAKWEIDPTPMFVPFFVLYFAICLTDAGYGLILSIFSLILLRRFKFGKNLLKILFILGIATIAIGLLTGGIFGIDFSSLSDRWTWAKNLRGKIMLFDPVQDPILLLVISFALGIIQIWFGIFLKMLENFNMQKYLDGILNQGSWLILISGIVLFVILPQNTKHLAKYMILIGVLSIFLFQGRDSKNIFVRLVKGLYALYGMTGILGDVLSYSRLLALALSTSVLGMIVNTIAILFIKIPIIGPLIMLGILILGHLFTLAIGTLGSFVHCTRLQFVEFFTKFYQGGGKPFKPFEKIYKYIIME